MNARIADPKVLLTDGSTVATTTVSTAIGGVVRCFREVVRTRVYFRVAGVEVHFICGVVGVVYSEAVQDAA